MKPSDIKVGVTYCAASGVGRWKTRKVIAIERIPPAVADSWVRFEYEDADGCLRRSGCWLSVFARWADRERCEVEESTQ